MTHSYNDDNVLAKEFNCIYNPNHNTCLFYETHEILSLYTNKKIIIWLGLPGVETFIVTMDKGYKIIDGEVYDDKDPVEIVLSNKDNIETSFIFAIKPLDTKTYAKLKLIF